MEAGILCALIMATKKPTKTASKKAKAPTKATPKKTTPRKSAAATGELAKAYAPQDVEAAMSALWDEKKIGAAKGTSTKNAWTIMMPPPNVTGQLHLGHAVTLTIEDIMTRYQRMQGKDALWLPGTDHAGIATQAVVERHLAEQGIKRDVLGREAFIEKVWEWKDVYHDRIIKQTKKMGASCDWDRERFTLDDDASASVQKAFLKLYKKGLIYRDKRLVNWDPGSESVISDIEVDYKEVEGNLYYVRYFVNATDKSVCVATTRPETMLGDMAVAVHPDDPRYLEYIGKEVILPITNKLIPIIADKRVDPKFGTGAVKITPAHDPLDAAIGRDHKLSSIVVIGPHGRMTKHAGRFKGMPITEARNSIIRYLDDIGNLEKIVKHTHQVGFSSRSGAVIEPLESLQWFVNMKPLAEKAIKAVQKKEMRFVPDRFEGEFLRWMENMQDWCISRQLWWGHQLPVWYCKKVADWGPKSRKKTKEGCMKTIVADTQPDACPHCGNLNLMRDPDVLDTWFSSGLWPFSTLGWPKKTKDMDTFYPNQVLETGRDILFFWVARMITLGIELTGQVPFKDIYLHGLVCDAHGKKMSKSTGNGIDPIDMIEKFGTDALRLSLTTGATPGQDIKFSEEKISAQRNFVNKLWNASRYTFGVLGTKLDIPTNPLPTSLADKWILSRLNTVIQEMTVSLDKYAFAEAIARLEDFVWHEFCDWYLELSKDKPNPKVLAHVLAQILRLAHPFMPFVTEKLWGQYFLKAKKMPVLALEKWPKAIAARVQPKVEKEMKLTLAAITAIRSVRSELNVEPARKIAAVIYAGSAESLVKKNANEIKKLARLASLKVAKSGKEIDHAVAKFEEGLEIYLPLEKLIDPKEEKKRLIADLATAKQFQEIVAGKLANANFVDRAPKEVVDGEKKKLTDAEEKIAKIEDRLSTLK